MKILNVKPGTREWHEVRARHNTASEASVMMGASKKLKRDDLLYIKATGDEIEISEWVQKNLFDKGHEVEAKARPIAESIVGDELFPAVALDDDEYLLASYDGLTIFQDAAWECKLWNEEKAAEVREGRVPEEDVWQVIQHLAVGATKVLYMVTDGTEEKTVYVWKTLEDGDLKKLMANWRQFDKDRNNYKPPERKPEVAAEAVTDLPAVHVQVSGEISITDNFDLFEQALTDFLDHQLIRKPKTDQDFANLDLQIKALKKAEDALNHAEASILVQVESIDTAKRRKDMLHKLARDNRLIAEKLFEAEKKNRRAAIIQSGKDALAEEIRQINATLEGVVLPEIAADFAGAAKGKRTMDTIQSAVNDELARAKIAANETVNTIRANLKTLDEKAPEHRFLFSDLQSIVTKAQDDFSALVQLRKSEHEKAEAERVEKIRQEEAAKLAREQAEREVAKSKPPEQKPETPEPEPTRQVTRYEAATQQASAPRVPGSTPPQFYVSYSANTVRMRHYSTDVTYVMTPRGASMLREALDQAIRKAVDAT